MLTHLASLLGDNLDNIDKAGFAVVLGFSSIFRKQNNQERVMYYVRNPISTHSRDFFSTVRELKKKKKKEEPCILNRTLHLEKSIFVKYFRVFR